MYVVAMIFSPFVGSSLQQLSIHIPKLLHYASGLIFDSVPPPPAPSSAIPSSYSSEHVTPHATHTVRGAGSQVTAVVSTHGEKMNLDQVHVASSPGPFPAERIVFVCDLHVNFHL